MPWPVLVGGRSDPAVLARIGPITRVQARQLTSLAATSAATRWRIILTDDNGCALAIEPFQSPPGILTGRPAGVARRGPPGNASRGPTGIAPCGPPGNASRGPTGIAPSGPPGTAPVGQESAAATTTAVVGRVSITVRASQAAILTAGPGLGGDAVPGASTGPAVILRAAVARAAARAAARLHEAQTADIRAGGNCAHIRSTAAYRPPPRLRELIAARDGTCRSPTCGQPAWRGDLDHTIPWHDGGPTCICNLGALCRTHHKIKQLPGWKLQQPAAGSFRWTTPAGRSYSVNPDPYPL